MQLPREFLDKINLDVSRHKHPERLDWIKRNGMFEAMCGDKHFVLIHDDSFGYVVAEMKQASYTVQ